MRDLVVVGVVEGRVQSERGNNRENYLRTNFFSMYYTEEEEEKEKEKSFRLVGCRVWYK